MLNMSACLSDHISEFWVEIDFFFKSGDNYLKECKIQTTYRKGRFGWGI